jgi:hypothetical protein
MRKLYLKIFCITLFFQFYCTGISGQIENVPSNKKLRYHLPQEGGGKTVIIDTITPLKSLIERLNKKWEFEFTGKGYWIGYTDDMFSIAAYKDSAIKQLLDFFDSTANLKGRIGVIYTLHLIGINCSIAGRFFEKFTNTHARDALLLLAQRKEYTSQVIQLLARDPWQTDLPVLVELLKKTTENAILNNALFRYIKEGVPFRENLPGTIDSMNILLHDSMGIRNIGNFFIAYREPDLANPDYGNSISHDYVVQFQAGLKGRVFRKLTFNIAESKIIKQYFSCDSSLQVKGFCDELKYLLRRFSNIKLYNITSYVSLNDRFHHHIDGNNIVIYTPDQTRLRWIEYFAKIYK